MVCMMLVLFRWLSRWLIRMELVEWLIRCSFSVWLDWVRMLCSLCSMWVVRLRMWLVVVLFLVFLCILF